MLFLLSMPSTTLLWFIIEHLVHFDDAVENQRLFQLCRGDFFQIGGSKIDCAIDKITAWPMWLYKNNLASSVDLIVNFSLYG